MASAYSILITAYLHIVLRISIFIRQEDALFKQVPPLASWLFLLGLLDILWNTSFCYVKYFHLPVVAEFVVETLAAILFTEFGLLVIWTTLENLCSALTIWTMMKLNIYPCSYAPYVLGFTTTVLSIYCVASIAIACDHIYFLRKRGRIVLQRIRDMYINLQKHFFAEKKCNIQEPEVHITQDLISPKRNRRQGCTRYRVKRKTTPTC